MASLDCSYRASKSRRNTDMGGWKRIGTFPLIFTFAASACYCRLYLTNTVDATVTVWLMSQKNPKSWNVFDNVGRVLSKTASLLLRRFVFRMVSRRSERKTRVTGDEVQGNIGRVKKGGEARLAPLLFPAFLCAQIFIERETSGYEVAKQL